MKFKCPECGDQVDFEETDLNFFVGHISGNNFLKTKRTEFHGLCRTCGTAFHITGERRSFVQYPKKEGV